MLNVGAGYFWLFMVSARDGHRWVPCQVQIRTPGFAGQTQLCNSAVANAWEVIPGTGDTSDMTKKTTCWVKLVLDPGSAKHNFDG